jgi:hypothetical protein
VQTGKKTHIGTGCALPLAWRWVSAAGSAALVCCGEFAGELLRKNVSIWADALLPASRGSEGQLHRLRSDCASTYTHDGGCWRLDSGV